MAVVDRTCSCQSCAGFHRLVDGLHLHTALKRLSKAEIYDAFAWMTDHGFDVHAMPTGRAMETAPVGGWRAKGNGDANGVTDGVAHD